MCPLLDEDIEQYGAQLGRCRQDSLNMLFRAVTLGNERDCRVLDDHLAWLYLANIVAWSSGQMSLNVMELSTLPGFAMALAAMATKRRAHVLPAHTKMLPMLWVDSRERLITVTECPAAAISRTNSWPMQ